MAKTGRPKKEASTLPEGWEGAVLKLYAEGASDVEIRAHLAEAIGSLSQDLWERWLLDEPDFSLTIKRGRMLSQVWWEKKGRQNLDNKDFSPTLWYMNMKNRFGWADKQEVVSEGALTIRIVEDATDE
jgi:hypothetical protein